jgi:3-hydroxymyristoyl/3-hydroxydecanoyl-(acyl carrier protein) dehydratase
VYFAAMIDLEKEMANTYKILKQSEQMLQVELNVPPSWTYFVGHFPQGPLLPAVAIIDMSQYLIGTYLLVSGGAPLSLRRLSNFRIKNPVHPGCQVQIEIEREMSSEVGVFDFNILWKKFAENKLYAELSLRVAAP